VAKFYAHYGITQTGFLGTQISLPSIPRQIADNQTMSAQVDSTPMLIVNGKYRLMPQSADG
jgi:thiol:disulfide interchange protein DsbA